MISSVTITPADTAAGATSTVTFAFTTASNIAATGKIVITFPSGYDLTGTPAAASTSDLDGTLAAAVSGQVVTITRSSGTAFTAGAIDDLTLTNIKKSHRNLSAKFPLFHIP